MPITATPPPPAFLTLAEAAELLAVSTKTMRRRIADGSVPAVRVGRLIRIATADLATVGAPIGGGVR